MFGTAQACQETRGSTLGLDFDSFTGFLDAGMRGKVPPAPLWKGRKKTLVCFTENLSLRAITLIMLQIDSVGII